MRTNTNTTSRSRAAVLAFAAALTLTLRAAQAVAAPDPAAWGESSGYDAIEANRAATSSLVMASAPAFGAASGYDALEAQRVAYWASISAPLSGEAARVEIAREALDSGEIGGVQEEALTELVAAADADSAVAPVDERVTQFGRIR